MSIHAVFVVGGPALLLCAGCAHGLFSGVRYPDRSRPVALIETRGGVERGATTSEGILFLGRTAVEGPCRVHYFLGPAPTPMVEDGEIRPAGGVFYAAEIDLAHQHVHILERELLPEDELVAIVHLGADAREVPVRRASDAGGPAGDLLDWPGTSLPAGTGVFVRERLPRSGELLPRDRERLFFVGLVSGEATLSGPDGERKYVTFTGSDRLRELLAKPRSHPQQEWVKYRPDDITVIKKR